MKILEWILTIFRLFSSRPSVIETFHLIDGWANLDNVVNDSVLSAFAQHFKRHLCSYFAGIHKKIRFVSSH